MNNIDTELSLLKQRLAALEEQKRIEIEKKKNPMKILWEILEEKKKRPNYLAGASRGQHGRPNNPNMHMSTEDREWVIDQNDKVEFLEPIFNMLKKIEERLDITINNQYYNQDIWSEPELKSNIVDEIHKDLYIKLSKQEEEIAGLKNQFESLFNNGFILRNKNTKTYMRVATCPASNGYDIAANRLGCGIELEYTPPSRSAKEGGKAEENIIWILEHIK
jgi:hypothetical protein